jgi:PIN domain nuclease of toxin-antitoxin system
MGDPSRLRFLLDTHIWLWLFDKDKRLRPRTLQALEREENELWLSPISTWEILTLQQKGKIELPANLPAWVEQAIAGVKEAVITHEIALASRQLAPLKDPADRLIAATALVMDLTLVTADERLLELKNIKTMANH